MFLKDLIFFVLFNASLNPCGLVCKISKVATSEKHLENVVKLKAPLLAVTPDTNSTLIQNPPHCVQMLCKFVCFYGKSEEIEKDILIVSKKNNYFCSSIEELRLYSYEFPGDKLSYGFLGNYSDKVDTLYLASSKITDIEGGCFAGGKFQGIYFENLHLKELRKELFEGISYDFNTLSIIQKETPLEAVNSDFLCQIKYQIKYLTLQAGLKSVHNLTGGDFLLNNLIYTDFSHNNLSKDMNYTTFSGVSRIEHMDLSHSNLEYLPAYLFSEIISTLEYLDLSYNKLKTISRNIFGWKEIPHGLKVYAGGNNWSCSCGLQNEMRHIFLHYSTALVCYEPEYYRGCSVFEYGICDETSSEVSIESNNKTTTEGHNSMVPTTLDDESPPLTTFAGYDRNSSFATPKSLAELDCLASRTNISQRLIHFIQYPLIEFNVILQKNMRVNVVVEFSDRTRDSFGLIWFCKATTKYHKMEINYNEYGLGCYKNIDLVTAVKDLIPNTAYTFCLVFKQQLNVSPFNCKSMHVSDNLDTKTSTWLSRDMRTIGLSLVIFGIIMFIFAGIFMIYLLLKHKPILVKGSKRVTTLHANKGDIVVLPKKKSVRSIREKEKELARYAPFNYIRKRRKSNDSEDSYDSYINTNLYEVIPALEDLPTNSLSNVIKEKVANETNYPESDDCYLKPLEPLFSSADLDQYAEIPLRAKRNSNDALPQRPADPPSLFLTLSEVQGDPEYAYLSTIYIMDSQV